jgi:hypothetical protein
VSAEGGDKQAAGNADNVFRDRFEEFFHGVLLAILIAETSARRNP